MLNRLLFFIFALFLGVVAFFCYDFYRFIDTPLLSDSINGHSQSIVFQVQSSTSLKKLNQKLAELKIFSSKKHQFYFEGLIHLHQASGRLKAGEYALSSHDTPKELAQKLINGQVILYGFTIVEGWSFQDILEALEKHPKLEKKLAHLTKEEVIQKLNLPAQPEGWLYPSTYYFSLGFSDEAVLKKANQLMVKTLADEWQNRSPHVLLTSPYEALILASIIEKETAKISERALMSGVYQLRLKHKMLLQADPTVLYGLSERKKKLSKIDLQSDSPYNTYKRLGLPPTPIAAPSLSSVRAACQPDFQGYFYFVATGNGGHYFSKDLAEHNQAVRQYQLKLN
jgi:UPF0755 protein